MNNNDENPSKAEEASNEKPNTTKTRMIQIPVQHFPATSRNTPSDELNLDNNFTERVPNFYSDRFESGSPFGSPSLFNQNNTRHNFKQKDPFDRRFPFSRLPDRDEFFDHVDFANNPAESFFRYNSPERSSLFDRLRSNSRSNTPPTSSTLRNRFDTKFENSPIRQTDGHQQQNANNQNSTSAATNYHRPNLNHAAPASTVEDDLKRTESPKRYATYANIQPNCNELSSSNSSSRIPIQVEHISNSPQIGRAHV